MVFDGLRRNVKNLLNYKSFINEYKRNIERIDELERLVDVHQEYLNNLYVYHTFEESQFLNGLRNVSYQLLLFMDNVCRKYEIDYWLDYGTCLGAIRHGGFIPWDDDLDVGMIRKDYLKFMEVIPKEIEAAQLENVSSPIKQSKHKIPRDRWIQLKYIYPGFNGSFSTIDVFPYDYITKWDKSTIQDDFQNARIKYYDQKLNKVDNETILKDYYEALNLNMEREDYFIPAVENVRGKVNIYSFKILKTEDYFPLKRVPFGPYNLPVPKNHDKYLKKIYGKKYFTIPKSIRHHSRLQRFVKSENIMDILDEAYTSLKEANDNFEH